MAEHKQWYAPATSSLTAARVRSGRREIKKRNRPEKASTVKGVNFDKATQKWLVRVSENGKQRYFGRYATQELAEKASTDYKKTQTAEGGDAETETDPTKKGKKPPPVKPPAKKAKVDKVDVAVVEKKVEAPKLEAPKKAPKD